MARGIEKLLARAVGTAKKTISDGGGLWLSVNRNGARSWTFRYMLQGRAREMGLGGLDKVSLAAAREKARELRQMLGQKIDPLAARDAADAAATLATAKVRTFEDAAADFLINRENLWRNTKHRAQWHSTLRQYAFPILGSISVEAIDTDLLLKVLQQNVAPAGEPAKSFWTSLTETADRVRGRIAAILDAEIARGNRPQANPARWKGHLSTILPAPSKLRDVTPHAALPYRELPAFMAELRKREAIAARALEFLILTACRTSECLEATWGEIDLADRMWTIPAERMKRKRKHMVPLSSGALLLLQRMSEIRQSEYIFPGARGGQPLSNMALLMMLGRMGRGDLTAHGFRSTFKDWCGEEAICPNEVSEMALAHGIPDQSEAAYRRLTFVDRRRVVMQQWADFCAMQPAAGNVVPLREPEFSG